MARSKLGILALWGLVSAPACHGTPHSENAQEQATPSSETTRATAPRRAEELDQAGQLAAALPLYDARARQTSGDADRLRYAGALLRSGRKEPALGLLDGLAHESNGTENGSPRDKAGIVASSLLAGGFPSLAVRYAADASKTGDDPRRTLLLLRALVASADLDAAKKLASDLLPASGEWSSGPRYELARSLIALGNGSGAEKLLAGKNGEAVGEMFRESVLANLSLVSEDWQRAERLFSDSEKALPADLGGRVSREWRNAKREIASVRLRRALALSFLGRKREAMAEARQARSSDEEPVRTNAILLHAATLVAEGRRAEATAMLAELSGHDPRLASSITPIETAIANGPLTPELVQPLERAVAAEDASLGFVAEDVSKILVSSAGIPVPAPTYAATR